MERGHDALKRKRTDASANLPPKRERLNSTQAGDSQTPSAACKDSSEQIRSTVREIYQAYTTLSDGAPTVAAFNTLLRASTGDLASQRLAARLVPRFIAMFPDQVETAASALIQMHNRQAEEGDHVKSLHEQARTDALHGMGSVLKAAQVCRAPPSEAAVKLVLDHLFRLLPQAAAMDEPSEPEEEGEVAACNHSTASMQFLKKLLSEALHLHPAITMSHCTACLASSAYLDGRSSSTGNGCADAQLQAGVRLWLQEQLLKERSPSREGTPMSQAAADGLAAATTAAAAVAAAGTAGGWSKAVGVAPKGCLLHNVLDESEELQRWVMQQARTRAAAPPEVRTLLETALQLLPEHKQLATAKPNIDTGPTAAAAITNASRSKQQQRLSSSNSLPSQHRQQQPNGIGLANGLEPLSRSLSSPTYLERGKLKAGRSGLASAGAELRSQFPRPPGPICRAEACLHVLNLPLDVAQQEVQQALGAEEVWLIPEPGGSCNSACCTFKGVLEAAKAYLRHNGQQRLGLQRPPFTLAFCDKIPTCSSNAADAAAQPSAYVWATKEAVGDAESITEELRAAGLQLSHVHRVNNAAEPGTLLQTPSGAHAISVVAYLLKKHPQSQQHKAGLLVDEQELPPLPSEPPPSAAAAAATIDWSGNKQQQQGMPPLPPGPPPSLQQQQQQLDRVLTAASSGGRPISPALQQQQQPPSGYADGSSSFRRSYSSPSMGNAVAAAGSGWRDSPTEWPVQQQGRWGPSPLHQQQAHRMGNPGIPPPVPPPLPPGQQPPGQAAGMAPGSSSSSGGWHAVHQQQHLHHHHHQQHQQHNRWGQPGLPPGGPHPGPMPPTAPHPSTIAAAIAPSHAAAQHHAAHLQLVQQLARQSPLQQATQTSPGAVFAPVLRTGSSGTSPAQPAGQGPGTGSSVHMTPSRALWQGSLVKQSVPLCGVACHPATSAVGQQTMAGLAPEPRWWPEQLHVNYRISVADAVDQYTHCAAEQRAIRLLLPLNPANGDTQQLQQFINYLNGKERAGMVKLPAVREHGLGPRAVYLVVPKAQVCQQLQLGWDGNDVMLIAVVVPQPGTAGVVHPGGSGSGHRQYRG